MRTAVSPPHFEDYRSRLADRAAAVDTGLLAAHGLLPKPAEHYLSGTYPPLKAMTQADDSEVLWGATERVNLYLHLPFCRQRCTFCHFAKEIQATPDRISRYVDALTTEIAMMAARLGPRRVDSVYFGGCTPSTLPPADLARVFVALQEKFPWELHTEVTFGLHLQVVRDRVQLAQQFDVLRSGGVNRIAIGIQSLDDRVLRTLNRGHTAAEALTLVDILQHSPFDNVSVDLMHGLPYETPQLWFDTLSTIVERGVQKMNIFPLFLKVTDSRSTWTSTQPTSSAASDTAQRPATRDGPSPTRSTRCSDSCTRQRNPS